MRKKAKLPSFLLKNKSKSSINSEKLKINMFKKNLLDKKKKTKCVSHSTINLFYENPISFFKNEKKLLEKK